MKCAFFYACRKLSLILASMNFSKLKFREANQYLWLIALIGLALGVANYAMGVWDTLGQSLVHQVIISFVIGYALLVVIYNFPRQQSKIREFAMLSALFILIGIIGTEGDKLVKTILFRQGDYQLFEFTGTHVFNVVLTIILGFMNRNFLFPKSTEEKVPAEEETMKTVLRAVPVKKGEAIVLYSLDEVIFFEAYDNYSFLHDFSGNKFLCNYSLSFLEKRLDNNFMRVHRKYLINQDQIHQIKPHFKQRFIIEFKNAEKTSVTSGAGYANRVKSIFKL